MKEPNPIGPISPCYAHAAKGKDGKLLHQKPWEPLFTSFGQRQVSAASISPVRSARSWILTTTTSTKSPGGPLSSPKKWFPKEEVGGWGGWRRGKHSPFRLLGEDGN